jgi:hypothetical protein
MNVVFENIEDRKEEMPVKSRGEGVTIVLGDAPGQNLGHLDGGRRTS